MERNAGIELISRERARDQRSGEVGRSLIGLLKSERERSRTGTLSRRLDDDVELMVIEPRRRSLLAEVDCRGRSCCSG